MFSREGKRVVDSNTQERGECHKEKERSFSSGSMNTGPEKLYLTTFSIFYEKFIMI